MVTRSQVEVHPKASTQGSWSRWEDVSRVQGTELHHCFATRKCPHFRGFWVNQVKLCLFKCISGLQTMFTGSHQDCSVTSYLYNRIWCYSRITHGFRAPTILHSTYLWNHKKKKKNPQRFLLRVNVVLRALTCGLEMHNHTERSCPKK